MDVLSLVGIVLALLAVLGGNVIEGGHLGSLVNLPAFLIVLGGTIGAIILQHSGAVLKRGMKQLAWVILPPRLNYDEGAQQIIEWSQIARKEGLLGLEEAAERYDDEFQKKGLQLLVDGAEAESIRYVLELEIGSRERRELQAAKLFDAMGGYAPTLGILGAVLGLIHVMGNLEDPSKLGPGIATAFVATIYGVAFANLLFFPVANKIRTIVSDQCHYREMLTEGIVAIAEGENPRSIELRLQSFLGG